MDQKHRLTLPESGEPSAAEPGSLLFIGTATTLIQYGGFRVLTDPNFLHAGQPADLGYGLHSQRLTNPALEVEDLPALDFCLLSQTHGDHWDEVASAKLRKDLPVVTTGHAAKALNDQGFYRTYALDTWETFTARKGNRWLRITALPARHGPQVTDLVLPPVMGSLLDWGAWNNAERFRMFISGDTLIYDDLQEVPQRFPDIHLALLHLGGTKVMGDLVTMDAEQGVQMVQLLNPRHILPVHYSDYAVFKSPIEDFLEAARAAGFAGRVHFLRHGEQLPLDRLHAAG